MSVAEANALVYFMCPECRYAVTGVAPNYSPEAIRLNGSDVRCVKRNAKTAHCASVQLSNACFSDESGDENDAAGTAVTPKPKGSVSSLSIGAHGRSHTCSQTKGAVVVVYIVVRCQTTTQAAPTNVTRNHNRAPTTLASRLLR